LTLNPKEGYSVLGWFSTWLEYIPQVILVKTQSGKKRKTISNKQKVGRISNGNNQQSWKHQGRVHDPFKLD